jgi:hypothetical protein
MQELVPHHLQIECEKSLLVFHLHRPLHQDVEYQCQEQDNTANEVNDRNGYNSQNETICPLKTNIKPFFIYSIRLSDPHI